MCWPVCFRLVVFAAALCVFATSASAEAASPARPPAMDNLPVATDVRLGGDHTRTRFILDVSKNVQLTAFTLANPYRVVVDLPQLAFQLQAKAGQTGRGLVKAFRFGMVMPGGSRIVLDAAGPVRIDKAFVLDSIDDQPARVVIDLVAIDRDTFMRNLSVENRAQRPAEPPRSKPERGSARAVDRRPLIMLDPGHGGLDTGTSAHSGETEKTLVLDFALQLRDKLEKTGKFRVAMTRTEDRFVSLTERVRMARAEKAALFISIHADAVPRHENEVRGATVYTLSETASDDEAGRLADDENKADVIAGVDLSEGPADVADILIDLAQRETKVFSHQFARTLVSELKVAARLHKRPLRSAGFRVLKAPDVPSVLIEIGYMSNAQDLKLLRSESWRAKATSSIVQAVQTFFTTRVAAGLNASAD